jgi:adenylyltransferase/sulfurtransferase
MLTAPQYERYSRQILLPQLGEAGQQKLFQSKVLVIGAGGLGCAMLPYLAAAGIGHIGICDDDTIQLHNLHRQVLYNSSQIGMQKAICASAYITALNPSIKISTYTERLTNQNALSIFEGYDIIADGTDNFATRYLINDACILLNKPLVYGAIAMFEGQVAVFNHKSLDGQNTCHYRDIFPEPPAENEIPNCATAGVLGVLPGIIGSMQANEVIKLITGIGKPLHNKILLYNALDGNSIQLNISKNTAADTFRPKDKKAITDFNYEAACSATGEVAAEITADDLYLLPAKSFQLIDVRNEEELPKATNAEMIKIPLSLLHDNTGLLTASFLVTLCQSGQRSKQAAILLTKIFGNQKKIYSLKGGIFQLIKQ